jgi:hypothetical protein
MNRSPTLDQAEQGFSALAGQGAPCAADRGVLHSPSADGL